MKTSILVLVAILASVSPAYAQTVTTIYAFNGIQDGAFPSSPLVAGDNGELYGVTRYGGNRGLGCLQFYRCGTFYKLTPPSTPGGTWTETVLARFFGGPYGVWHPYGPLVRDGNGVLYGVAASLGQGAVYSLTPPPPGSGQIWGQQIIYNFTRDTPVHGAGELTVGPGGVIYLSAGTRDNNGTIVELLPPTETGGAWTPTYFQVRDDGSGGKNPTTPVAGDDVIYDAMQNGGAFGAGAFVSLKPPATPDGTWTESVLYNFQGTADGGSPYGLVNAGNGVLYGATFGGGLTGCSSGVNDYCGVIFQLSKVNGLEWTENAIYSFPFDGFDPGPSLPVIADGGVLYGTFNGPNLCGDGGSCGAIYKLTPPTSPGGVWTESTVYNFTGGTDGLQTSGPLTLGKDGKLYGITLFGGSANCNLPNSPGGCGTVFQLTP